MGRMSGVPSCVQPDTRGKAGGIKCKVRQDASTLGGRVGVTGWRWDGGIDELRDNTLCCSWGKGGWRKPVRYCTGR